MSNLCLPDLNTVTLACRLTRDPELRYLPSGTAVCEFGIAQSRKWKQQDGTQREEKYFGEVKCWNKTAEYVNQHITKGTAVLLTGRLALEEWTDRDSGQKRQKTRIVADRVQRLEWPDDGGRPAQDSQKKQAATEQEQSPAEDDLPF